MVRGALQAPRSRPALLPRVVSPRSESDGRPSGEKGLVASGEAERGASSGRRSPTISIKTIRRAATQAASCFQGGRSMTSPKPFTNTTSPAERAAVLKNDWKMNTLQGRAVTELLMEERGRYARPVNVTAAENAPVAYPGAPWTREHTGQEPPLGFDLNAVEPVGEPHEVSRHRRDITAASPGPAPDGAGAPQQAPLGAPATQQSRNNRLWRRPL